MPGVKSTFVVIGGGRCGLGLARAMFAASVPLAGVLSRSQSSRRRARRYLPGVAITPFRPPIPVASCYLLCVADDSIAETAAALAAMLGEHSRPVVLHTSGIHPSSLLAPLRSCGAALGSFHPLLAFPPPPAPPPNLRDAVAAIEGDVAAVRLAFRLARWLEMRPLRLAPEEKALYHAAAALAANLTHVLVVAAKEILTQVGFPPAQAREALRPLVLGSCQAALRAKGLERLTGALARGDEGTVTAHLAALPPDLSAAYRALAEVARARLRIAEEADLSRPARPVLH